MDYTKYKNKLSYGLSQGEVEVIEKENEIIMLNFVGTKAQISAKELELAKALKDREDEFRKSYYLETEKLNELFWKEAFLELGIDWDHPKADLLREKAWSHGHSDGHSQVFYWLNEFSELLY